MSAGAHPPHDSGAPLLVHLPGAEATARLGARIARQLTPGLRLYLRGPLGSGKTTLVRGLLAALGWRGRVKSPSYSLVELYVVSSLHLYHFDFYRFENPDEFADAGLEELFDRDAVCVVEWPERAGGRLPSADLEITLAIVGSDRAAELRAASEAGARCIEKLRVG